MFALKKTEVRTQVRNVVRYTFKCSKITRNCSVVVYAVTLYFLQVSLNTKMRPFYLGSVAGHHLKMSHLMTINYCIYEYCIIFRYLIDFLCDRHTLGIGYTEATRQ